MKEKNRKENSTPSTGSSGEEEKEEKKGREGEEEGGRWQSIEGSARGHSSDQPSNLVKAVCHLQIDVKKSLDPVSISGSFFFFSSPCLKQFSSLLETQLPSFFWLFFFHLPLRLV
ncbi:hypothetical protein IE53DRAFT_134958 [Violaceomyces palustris]|uniref:Uncharacterized protein n=1 Tax=Violaceomyces palustris TaxID=1673888 RepID=A0ACD0NV83_9BASI|nr:hypothetical protein IE53DRAFT_134958 [Violaceomyces palustris]